MSDSRVRVLLRIPAELKERLTELAEREHRSLNKQIEYLLERVIQEEIAPQMGETAHRKGERNKRH
jgi:hypothetical protein